jgi:hypothetical protein
VSQYTANAHLFYIGRIHLGQHHLGRGVPFALGLRSLLSECVILPTLRRLMEKTRLVAAVSMLATAIFIACADGSPTDVGRITSHDGGGLPIACAQWTCSALACGYNTTYPAWACCVENIYEGPDGYTLPLDSVPGYQCGLGSSGGQYDADTYCAADLLGHDIGGAAQCDVCESEFYCNAGCDFDSPCKIAARDYASQCLNSNACLNN